jgi:hypothetical protein
MFVAGLLSPILRSWCWVIANGTRTAPGRARNAATGCNGTAGSQVASEPVICFWMKRRRSAAQSAARISIAPQDWLSRYKAEKRSAPFFARLPLLIASGAY